MSFVRPYYLLDTNIVSEPTKPNANFNVMSKLETYSSVAAVSSVTLAELWKGIRMLPSGSSRQLNLIDFYNEEILALYQEIPFDRHAAIIYGDIFETLKQHGTPKPQFDLLIASTAIANNMILVTHNIKDFEDIPGLMLEDWFTPA